MRSINPAFIESLSFTSDQAKTIRALGEYRGKQRLYEKQRPEVLEELLSVAKIESTDASNRLEDIIAPRSRIESLVVQRVKPKNRSEQEIAGYRDVLELIHHSRKDMPITVNVIRQMHQGIYGFLPDPGGKWKSTDYEIVEKDETGKVVRVRFKPTSAVETPFAMETLVRHYNANAQSGSDALIVVPLLILDFLCVHPFRDGNGRAGRLLTLLALYHADYDVGRFISLERVIQESQESYYETLEESSQGWHDAQHNVHPWLDYFWGVLLKAYKEFEDRIQFADQAVLGKRLSKSEQVRLAIERKNNPFPIVELARDCPGISRETIKNVLEDMKSKGLIESRGRGRGAKWHKLAKGNPTI